VEVLRQVGWLHRSQSFHRLRAPYWPKLLQIQSFPWAQSFRWKMSLYGSLKPSSLKPSSLKQGSLKHIMIDCVSIEGTYTHICKRALCIRTGTHVCILGWSLPAGSHQRNCIPSAWQLNSYHMPISASPMEDLSIHATFPSALL
jgi:hypothetical protein